MSDEELIIHICNGAEWALETLYQRYSRYAYVQAYRIVSDTMVAEDIVQDVFLAISHKAATYRPAHGNVGRWLQAIVYHRAIDYVRTTMRHDRQWMPLEDEYEQNTSAKEPEVWEEVWQHERDAIIHNALAQLSTEQRQAIELSFFNGYTHAEIARLWQVPLGTVKGRIRLGLQRLRQLLRKYDMEYTLA
jgi:RNA polymerase sigma-70 factor (ECF subfamily)